jgi:hypothetical protein
MTSCNGGMVPASSDAVAKRMTVATSAKNAKVRAGQHEAGTPFNIRRIDAGKLVLPTGRICVTDAYSADEFPPLKRLVPPGDLSRRDRRGRTPERFAVRERSLRLHRRDFQ